MLRLIETSCLPTNVIKTYACCAKRLIPLLIATQTVALESSADMGAGANAATLIGLTMVLGTSLPALNVISSAASVLTLRPHIERALDLRHKLTATVLHRYVFRV